MQTISETTSDKLNRIYDQYKIFVEGSFHSFLWEVMINGRFDGQKVALIYIQVGPHRIGVADAKDKGFFPVTFVLKPETKERQVELIEELNKEIFGLSAKEAFEIGIKSMAKK
jgi:hypothetical protein